MSEVGTRTSRLHAGAPGVRGLARSLGVQCSYVDTSGRQRHAAPEALERILDALGYRVDGSDPRELLHQRLADRYRRGVEPVLVAWNGRLTGVDLTFPPAQRSVGYVLTLETDEALTGRLERVGEVDVDGESFATARLDIHQDLPTGYHELRLEADGWSGRSTVVSAPKHAFAGDDQRRRGVFIPLYSLHSRRSWGAGSLGDLGELAAWLSGAGGNAVMTLPLLAGFLGDDLEPSPYAPVSRRYWNELYLDVLAVPEVQRSPEAQELVTSSLALIEDLRTSRLVDHRRQAAIQRRVLETAHRWLRTSGGRRLDAHLRFLSEHPETVDYARFRAASEVRGSRWRTWPTQMATGTLSDDDVELDRLRYHAYVQWLCREQMDTLRNTLDRHGVELHLDLPVGSHPDGYDAWRDRSTFAPGVSVGAPPDPFFTGGQDWGFAPSHPEHSRLDAHRSFRKALSHHMAVADALRIDHVMALHRLYWIPDGFPATDGVYVRNPAEELFAILSLESRRHRCRVEGEDLGTVPRTVRRALRRHRIARSYVLQFAIHPGGDPQLDPPPRDALATLETHDLPPFAAFWDAIDIEDRVERGRLSAEGADDERAGRERVRRALVDELCRAGWLDPGRASDPAEVLRASLAFLGAGSARTALANLEDLWLEHRPQNVPGTGSERPNWCRRARYDLETFSRDQDVVASLQALVQPEIRRPTRLRARR